ncbi:uncharacterized protein RAG0_02776 [Rhynchosporium agropyri]|uniref:Uncharacterized protein n=1 Tax=Rhynchosporium agropyri TaxID=914238 RepID=A0A1E1K2L8_9HELO|nr:uncharacterized protein RAG0_02776 [Rhynchosporium agropyri]
MASTTFALVDARKSILDDGFLALHDSVVGGHVLDIQQKDFPFLSEYGLEFCKINFLDDTRIQSILESFLPWSGLGLCLKWNNDPGHNFSFRKGGTKAGLRVLLVQLWSVGSRVAYWGGSHLLSPPAVGAANGLWEVPSAALKRAGCKQTEITFEQGGLAILDARLAFEIKDGFSITSAFATEDELKKWAKMFLPRLPGLEAKVTDMGSIHPKIGVNFAFKDQEPK